MDAEDQLSKLATLIGEPVRARMLWQLLDGKAFTATELALHASVSLPNASMHLARLTEAGLLAGEKQGRHRYFRFAKPEVAYAIEALANLLPPVPQAEAALPSGIKYCRSCYDHLAGYVGVQLNNRLLEEKILRAEGTEYSVTPKGQKWLQQSLGLDVPALQQQRRVFARPCLDWSERRHHLAGTLGAALLQMLLQQDWMRRQKNTRILVVTAKGRKALYEQLGIVVN